MRLSERWKHRQYFIPRSDRDQVVVICAERWSAGKMVSMLSFCSDKLFIVSLLLLTQLPGVLLVCKAFVWDDLRSLLLLLQLPGAVILLVWAGFGQVRRNRKAHIYRSTKGGAETSLRRHPHLQGSCRIRWTVAGHSGTLFYFLLPKNLRSCDLFTRVTASTCYQVERADFTK